MFPVTLTIHDRSSLDVVLAALSRNAPQNTTVVIDETTAVSKAEPKAARAKAAKGEPLTATEAAAALDGHATPEAKAETPPPAAASAPAPAPAALTYEAVAAVVTKVARMRSRDTAVSVLAKFGAASLKDVTPERYAEVIAACEEALK
jgi:hypothetical protein